MPDDRQFTSDNDGDKRNTVHGDHPEKEEGTGTPPSRSIMYSTIFLAALLLAGGAVAVHVLTSTLRRELRETVASIADARDDILKCMAKDAAPAGNSAAVGPKQAAAGQRALDLGGETLAAGQTDKALLYFINGVNHDPSRMELIQSLADAALNSESTELAERAIGVLELTTVQVAPDDMSTVLGRIAELRAKVAPPPIPKLTPDQAAERLQELCNTYAPDAIWKDGERMATGLSEIEFSQQMIEVSRADANDDRYSEVIRGSDELARHLHRVQATQPLLYYIDACVDEMDAIVKENAPDAARFSSVSASAQGVLAQTWGSIHTLPKSMQEEFRTIPGKMKKIEMEFQDKISTVPYARAIELIDAEERDNNGTFTERIRRLTEALTNAAQEGEAIASTEKRIKLLSRIQNARSSNLVQLEIERRAAYQKWALGCLNGFMIGWNLNMSVKNAEAQQWYAQHDIARIDETLLVPEVSRVLGRVMSCMTGELNAKNGANIEYTMAATTKRTLEEF